MSQVSPILKAGIIRSNKIQTQLLQIGKTSNFEKNKFQRNGLNIRTIERKLLIKLREIKKYIRTDKREVRTELQELETQITTIQQQVAAIQLELSTGDVPNTALQSIFEGKLGDLVTVTTPSGTLFGVVTLVAADVVVLTESNGDILIIPFSKVTSVQ